MCLYLSHVYISLTSSHAARAAATAPTVTRPASTPAPPSRDSIVAPVPRTRQGKSASKAIDAAWQARPAVKRAARGAAARDQGAGPASIRARRTRKRGAYL